MKAWHLVGAGALGLALLGGGLGGGHGSGLPSPERVTANAAGGYGAAKCISNARACLGRPGGGGGGAGGGSGGGSSSKKDAASTTTAAPVTAPPTTQPPASPPMGNGGPQLRSSVPRGADRPMPRLGDPERRPGQLPPMPGPSPLPQLAG